MIVASLIWDLANELKKDNGAFAEYTAADADLVLRIPDDVTFEEASSVGIALLTAGQTLYQTLQLNLPTSPYKTLFPVLVYGASSSVGMYVVQLAKLSGLQVLAVASRKNFEYLEGLGAAKCFDYHDIDVVKQIKGFAPDLAHAVDCISEGSSPELVSESFGSKGGQIATLLLYPQIKRKDVTAGLSLYYTEFGRVF